jgi:hypothetical protein
VGIAEESARCIGTPVASAHAVIPSLRITLAAEAFAFAGGTATAGW